MPAGRPTKYLPIYAEQVFECMARGYSLTAFAGEIGVSRATVDNWMKAEPEFLEACQRAKARRCLQWETMAITCARGEAGNGASGMIAFGLKNMGDGEWRDKQEIEHAGKDGGPIEIARIERVIVKPSDPDA